jgi:hypothetical protein
MQQMCKSRVLAAIAIVCSSAACDSEHTVDNESVLCPGSTLTVNGEHHSISIAAPSTLVRTYAADGVRETVELIPRDRRWNGSLGLYIPSGIGSTHIVAEEGIQFFSTSEDLQQWIEWNRSVGGQLRYTSDGLFVRWTVSHAADKDSGPKHSLAVSVFQLLLDGEKPDNLTGARPEAFSLSIPDSACTIGNPRNSTFVASEPATIGGRAYSGWALDVMKAHDITAEEVEQVVEHGESVVTGNLTTYMPPNSSSWANSFRVKTTNSGKVVLIVK